MRAQGTSQARATLLTADHTRGAATAHIIHAQVVPLFYCCSLLAVNDQVFRCKATLGQADTSDSVGRRLKRQRERMTWLLLEARLDEARMRWHRDRRLLHVARLRFDHKCLVARRSRVDAEETSWNGRARSRGPWVAPAKVVLFLPGPRLHRCGRTLQQHVAERVVVAGC
jgi:hypothetical protein